MNQFWGTCELTNLHCVLGEALPLRKISIAKNVFNESESRECLTKCINFFAHYIWTLSKNIYD